MNTLENNKLIAEFMGAKFKENEFYFPAIVFKNGKNYFENHELKFHSDWNWLMEVIENIKKNCCFSNINISTGETSISIFDINEKNHFTTCPKNNYEGATMLSVTYRAVVNFIEWYNEQNS